MAPKSETKHVVAMPYPGRGHINPMINLCNSIASKTPNLRVTVVLTEEWLGLITSDDKPASDKICFATIPNVVPSELTRGEDVPGFVRATQTKMEDPFEQLLDRLELPVSIIIADTFLLWAVRVGGRRSIPVASFWPMSASVFSIFHHFELFVRNQHFPVEFSEKKNDIVDYIPGLTPMRVADLPPNFYHDGGKNLSMTVDAVSNASRAQYLLFTSVYELEAEAIEGLRPTIPTPIFSVGPTIPYMDLQDTASDRPDYVKWLDLKPPGSVLYVALGSYLSVTSAQRDEIAAGLRGSGVNYLWVSREDTSRVSENGLIVRWCDQLRVLCHRSVGGFWTHCGWNSIKEAIFAGVTMLTFPLRIDQVPNCKFVVEDWRIGWRVKEAGESRVVYGSEIAGIVRRFMDKGEGETKEMADRVWRLREMFRRAIANGGSSENDVGAFVTEITKCC